MSNEDRTDVITEEARVQRLGEIGLENFPPYLMNRIMGRYNAALRDEMANLGLTTPKMRTLAVLSVMCNCRVLSASPIGVRTTGKRASAEEMLESSPYKTTLNRV